MKRKMDVFLEGGDNEQKLSCYCYFQLLYLILIFIVELLQTVSGETKVKRFIERGASIRYLLWIRSCGPLSWRYGDMRYDICIFRKA